MIAASVVLLAIAMVACVAAMKPPRYRNWTIWELRARERRLRATATASFLAGVALIAVSISPLVTR
jgi:hypothetical protein